MNAIDAIFYIVILIMSVVIHEVSHGLAAESFGDHTARDAGRLTLNPINHLDLFGSIIIPAFLILTHAGFLFGWAKPVPYNPNNLKNRRWGSFFIALAGIAANFGLALIFGLTIRFTLGMGFSSNFYSILSVIVLVNLALGIFNLVPIPPLDGSKVILALLPESFSNLVFAYEQYSLILLLIFIVFFVNYLSPLLFYSFHLFTGLAL